MSEIETTERTTKGELARVQALIDASGARLAACRNAIEQAEAARKDAVRQQALGAGDAAQLDAAVRETTAALAQARQELADQEERGAALAAEARRLTDVLKAEREAALREQVRQSAARTQALAHDVDATLAAFITSYTAFDQALLQTVGMSPRLRERIGLVRDSVFAACAERLSYLPSFPPHLVASVRPALGPKYVNRTIPEIVPGGDQVAAWHASGTVW